MSNKYNDIKEIANEAYENWLEYIDPLKNNDAKPFNPNIQEKVRKIFHEKLGAKASALAGKTLDVLDDEISTEEYSQEMSTTIKRLGPQTYELGEKVAGKLTEKSGDRERSRATAGICLGDVITKNGKSLNDLITTCENNSAKAKEATA